MRKNLLVIVSAVALCLGAIGIAIPAVSLAATHNIPQGLVTLGAICFFTGLVLAAASWIAGMVQAARRTEWGWLVAIAVLNAPGALAYGIARARATA